MPKKKLVDRISALKTFIAGQEDRLAAIKSVQVIKAKIEAARKEAEVLEADEVKRKEEEKIEVAKVAADQKRRDDQRAKILFGAGLQSLDAGEAARIRVKILNALSPRDQKWMAEYVEKYKVALSAPEVAEPASQKSTEVSEPSGQNDPTASAVMRVFRAFDSMTLSHLEGEFLKSPEGEDRRLIETLFANLGKRSPLNHAG